MVSGALDARAHHERLHALARRHTATTQLSCHWQAKFLRCQHTSLPVRHYMTESPMLTRIILTLASLGEACSLSWRGRGCCSTSRGLQLVSESHAVQMRWR